MMSQRRYRTILLSSSVVILCSILLISMRLKEVYFVSEQFVDFNARQIAMVGDTLFFSEASIGVNGENIVWLWDFGDGSDIMMGREAKHSYATTGKYKVTLKAKDNPELHKTRLVIINSLVPRSKFSINKSVYGIGEDIEIRNESVNATDFVWDFDNGTYSTEATPKIKYNSQGEFKIRLISANILGEIHEFTQTVTIDKAVTFIERIDQQSEIHAAIFDENTLSQALTALANADKSRSQKKLIRNQIVIDSESLDFQVQGMSLENYINKLQLETSEQQVIITVTKITRNKENKIMGITIK